MLKDISFEANPGQMIMVIGPVGGGKSSLLKALLNTLHQQGGTMHKRGKVGYIPQESFLINNTVRENILFGEKFDHERYYKAIELSQLAADLKTLTGGEFAEIGEKGLNLSGGQKQRISIARALYSDTDIVLIDDALSALDAHVGDQIFNRVFMEQFVQRGKTVILCTHVLSFLNKADKIIFLQNGEILGQGSLKDLKSGCPEMQVFLADVERKNTLASLNLSGVKVSQNLLLSELEELPNRKRNPTKKLFQYDSAIYDELPFDESKSYISKNAMQEYQNESQRVVDNAINPDSIAEIEYCKELAHVTENNQVRRKSRFATGNQTTQGGLGEGRASGNLRADAKNENTIRRSQFETETHQDIEKAEPHVLTSNQKEKEKGKLTKQEKQEKGKISREYFIKYFGAGGMFLFICCQFLILLTVLSRVAVDYWVGTWTEKSIPSLTENQYIMIYGLIIVFFLLIGFIRSIAWANYAARSGMRVFNYLLNNIIKKPMSYFDTTPIGQILTLMGKDTDILDQNIPMFSIGVFTLGYQFLSIIVLSSISNIILLPIIIIVFVVVFYMVNLFLNFQRENKRIELKANSPIISNVIELYNGLILFRNYNRVGYLRKIYQNNVNHMVRSMMHSRHADVLIQFGTEFFMSIMIGCIFLFIVLGVVFSWPMIPDSLSLISVTMNWVITIPTFIGFFLFYYSMFIQFMGSIERIYSNVDNEIKEGDLALPKPNRPFPQTGCISVENIKVRYREGLPLVLKGVTFDIKDGEKVGIVGRTGSGKSSLLLALTRILNVENSVFYDRIQYDQKLGVYKGVSKEKIEKERRKNKKMNNFDLAIKIRTDEKNKNKR